MSLTPTPTALTLTAAIAIGLACTAEFEDDDQDRAAILMEAAAHTPPAPDAVPTDFNDQYCTLEARPAALLSVVDQRGRRLSGLDDDVSLIYTHRQANGEWSEPREGLCVAAGCETWGIGYAQPGEYIVGAFACNDYSLTRLRVGMTEDGCHVDTVTARLQLELAPTCSTAGAIETPAHPSCDWTEPISPSVVVMTGVIRGDLVIPRVPDQLTLHHGDETEAKPMDCLDEGCATFVSQDYGVAGDFRVRAELCGEVLTETVSVEANADGCDVTTKWVGLYTDSPQCAVFDYQTP